MEDCTRKPGDEKHIPVFGTDSIEVVIRARVRETIEAIVDKELEAALGAKKSARVGARDLTPGVRRLFMKDHGPTRGLDTPVAPKRRRCSDNSFLHS